MKTNTDPWAEISRPSVTGTLETKPVNPEDPWDFYWAKGIDGACFLILNYADASAGTGKLPTLKGIDVKLVQQERNLNTLLFCLTDQSYLDIFYILCLDLIEKANTARTEKQAVEFTITGTWRWHYLLRSGGRKKLSLEEQKGLIGELVVLRGIILEHLSPQNAIASWLGPKGSPKDFQFGSVAIESKARREGSTPTIRISSEHQLDGSGLDALFLHVTELDRQSADAFDSFTVRDKVIQVRGDISAMDQGVVDDYDALISAAGFSYEEDYSDCYWILGDTNLYEVTADFPRITADSLLPGVMRVSYDIALSNCNSFKCDVNDSLALYFEG